MWFICFATLYVLYVFIYVLLYSTLQIQKEIQKWFICPCSSKLYSRGILWEYNFFKRFWWTHVAIEYIWDWIWICLRAGLVLNWNWDHYNHKKYSLENFEDKACVYIHPPALADHPAVSFIFACWHTNKCQKYISVELGDQLGPPPSKTFPVLFFAPFYEHKRIKWTQHYNETQHKVQNNRFHMKERTHVLLRHRSYFLSMYFLFFYK